MPVQIRLSNFSERNSCLLYIPACFTFLLYTAKWNFISPLQQLIALDELTCSFCRRNDIPYNVVHGYLLTSLYRSALMVVAGLKPAEQYCVLSVIQMARDIVEEPLKNRDGSGYMLLIRIPNPEIARYCYNIIKDTRNK